MIIARENEVLDQSARAIFDNHQCNFTNNCDPTEDQSFQGDDVSKCLKRWVFLELVFFDYYLLTQQETFNTIYVCQKRFT